VFYSVDCRWLWKEQVYFNRCSKRCSFASSHARSRFLHQSTANRRWCFRDMISHVSVRRCFKSLSTLPSFLIYNLLMLHFFQPLLENSITNCSALYPFSLYKLCQNFVLLAEHQQTQTDVSVAPFPSLPFNRRTWWTKTLNRSAYVIYETMLTIIKISPYLSKLQLVKVGAFLRHRIDLGLMLLHGITYRCGCVDVPVVMWQMYKKRILTVLGCYVLPAIVRDLLR